MSRNSSVFTTNGGLITWEKPIYMSRNSSVFTTAEALEDFGYGST